MWELVAEIVAIIAVAFVLSLVIVLLGYGAQQLYWHVRRRQSIAYTSKWWSEAPTAFNRDAMNSHAVSRALLVRTLGLPATFNIWYEPLHVVGGATGKHYEIRAAPYFPIWDMTDRQRLCATPFDSYRLPQSDIALAQALYLQCPETEREFLALCNKTPM